MIRSSRIGFAHFTLALFAIAILVKAGQVQLVHGKAWRARADRQQSRQRDVPAPRGDILDASRRVLAQSRDMVRLEVAPREVNERARLRKALVSLGVDRPTIARALDSTLKWVFIPGRFLALDAAQAISLRGVYATNVVDRSYAVSAGARGIVGHVNADNAPVDGLELALDSILRGTPGAATLVHDPKGGNRESPVAPGVAPVKGSTVVLTLNTDLQEIAENALADAVAHTGAEGGDIVVLDPNDGEILALASRRLDPRRTAATTLTDPFEPGSTIKPFIACGLLERGRVRDVDSVDTGNGVFEVNGRTIHDDHLVGRVPLRDVLRYSSNIGIVKFAMRLSPREEFETLRDFGFGTPTGVPFPTESPGVLRAPVQWSRQSANSMAMGYEVSVTPLQLAMAYAAIANGGELLAPALVKEIDSPDGKVLYRHTRRVVRRVVSKSVADKVRHMLLGVVDDGTAVQATISDFELAGKTGTPRGTVHGHYVDGRYNPNFVGLFPGDAPQYVIFVKLTAPQGSIYGGSTAAPLTKAILQAAIAARDAALDRGKLAASRLPSTPDSIVMVARQAGAERSAEGGGAEHIQPQDSGSVPYVVTLPLPPAAVRVAEPPRPVPDVHGMALRDAVRSLHKAGFRVQLVHGSGPGTTPAAGELASSGTLVRLFYDF